MRLYWISVVFFSVGILINLIQIFTYLLHGDIEKKVSVVVSILIGLAICVAGFEITKRWLSRYERIVKEMSKSFPAWLCIPEATASYRIISINSNIVTLSKVAKGHPIELMTWPAQPISVHKESMQASAFKSFEGIAISPVENNKPIIRMLIYEPTYTALAKPVQSGALDMIISQLKGDTLVETVSLPTLSI